MTYPEDVVKLMLAVVVGGLIGLEREYSSKAAGFRSIVLICIGSTLFTMLSLQLGGAANADRIAANIITGIGFIGAGVVFKDGVSITGITTASSIWATAALGMAIGGGHYLLALEGMMLVITVLSLFELFERLVDRWHQVRSYRIVADGDVDFSVALEERMAALSLRFEKKRRMKSENAIVHTYDVSGKRDRIEEF
ncbi:MAG: MgtC/SapB family protein, partial [Candidatus Kapaibacterium sp.]